MRLKSLYLLSWIMLCLGVSPEASLPLVSNAYAAENRPADTIDLKQFPQRMSISKYETDDFNTIYRHLYEQVESDGADQVESAENQFVPQNSVLRTRLMTNCIAEQLRNQQAFPLTTMMKRLGYTPETVEEQTQIGTSLEHEQITFLEMTRLVPSHLWRNRDYSSATLDQIGTSREDDIYADRVRVKSASLWSISGQTLNQQSPFIRPANWSSLSCQVSFDTYRLFTKTSVASQFCFSRGSQGPRSKMSMLLPEGASLSASVPPPAPLPIIIMS